MEFCYNVEPFKLAATNSGRKIYRQCSVRLGNECDTNLFEVLEHCQLKILIGISPANLKLIGHLAIRPGGWRCFVSMLWPERTHFFGEGLLFLTMAMENRLQQSL